MPDRILARSFNDVAADYDRDRPSYPDELIDQACKVAGLGVGDAVLEIGCGTGQLTRSLLARGLRVTALEPGDRLMALARENLNGASDLTFVNARLEDASLPCGKYQAVFSASAVHWVDPDVSWQKAACVLVPGGTLALIQYFGLRDQRSTDDQQAMLAAIARVVPEIAASWPSYRDLDGTLAGVQERRGNISQVWAWLGSYEIARDHAAHLFDDVRVWLVPTLIEHSADDLNALLGTMSFWSRLSPEQRKSLISENNSLYERLGRPLRSSTVACLVTARHAASA
jgi:SAM-dependent methyltransferase